MNVKSLKVIGLWATLLFLVNNICVFGLITVLGQASGLLYSIPIAIIFAGFSGYKAASALAGSQGYEKKLQLVLAGASVALIAALISAVLNYFLTGQVKYSAGLMLFASALGGYLVDIKNLQADSSLPPQNLSG